MINTNILCASKDRNDFVPIALVVGEIAVGKEGVDDGKEKLNEVDCMV